MIFSPIAVLLASSPAAQLHFTERTIEAGLAVSIAHSSDHPADIMDGAGTVGDLNRDGWPDVFIPSTGRHRARLFLNQRDGTFEDVALGSGLDDALYRGCGSAVGDFDNDGWPDIYVTSFGDMSASPRVGGHRLYRNLGDGSFVEMAQQAGVHQTAPRWPDAWGAAFGDYDRDGDLDLFVCAWREQIEGNVLFRNNGDGSFTDVTHAAGVYNEFVKVFGATFADMNGDDWPELLLTSDFGTTTFYENLADGTFREVVGGLSPDIVLFGMGSDVADVDNDGDLDWFISATWWNHPPPFPNGNRLYYNDGPGQPLRAATESVGVNDGGWGWGTVIGDFDHDGFVDILETNGWRGHEWRHEPNYLWHNNQDGTFTNIAYPCNIHNVKQGRGLVRLDYDRDGDLDALFFSNQGLPRLYRNDLVDADSHWLVVEVDTDGHPDLAPGGFGTRIDIRAGSFERMNYLHGGNNYLGCSEMVAHFGLGTVEQLDEVRIRWANGTETVLHDVAADQHLQVSAPRPKDSRQR